MDSDDYRRWIVTARRVASRAEEAEDLLQDALLEAVRAGREDLSDPKNRSWFHGVLRNRAAMTARTEGRRRARERERTPAETEARDPASPTVLDALSPGVRKVATLILHGMNREEIRQALALTATAFRRRLTALRRGIETDAMRREMLALAYQRRSGELEVGLLRRTLVHTLKRTPGVGTHDPDGHLIVIRERDSASQSGPSRQPQDDALGEVTAC